MSLHPTAAYVVPEQTARVAKAVFLKGALYLQLYDHLGTIFQDQDFADLFPRHGQPAKALFRLALVTLLQYVEGLSDPGAANAVRGRIDWKYLLCLELQDSGFDFSVLCEFRDRLLSGGKERRLLEKLLAILKAHKFRLPDLAGNWVGTFWELDEHKLHFCPGFRMMKLLLGEFVQQCGDGSVMDWAGQPVKCRRSGYWPLRPVRCRQRRRTTRG